MGTDLLAAAMNIECNLKVMIGSGKFLKKVLTALVKVLDSNSNGSSKLKDKMDRFGKQNKLHTNAKENIILKITYH